jgi:signal peptidase II
MDKTSFAGKAVALASVAALTLLDQITKILAADRLADGPFVIIPGVFELRYLENRGAAFGMLQNQRVFFLVLTVAFLAIITYIYLRIPADRKYLPLRILSIVVTAGAIGNFIDRLILVYVRDFLYFSLIDFPIFNVADIYVTVSAFVFFVLVLTYYKDSDLEFLSEKKDKE